MNVKPVTDFFKKVAKNTVNLVEKGSHFNGGIVYPEYKDIKITKGQEVDHVSHDHS